MKTVKFEFFGKYMKTDLDVSNEKEAVKELAKRINIISLEEKKDLFSDLKDNVIFNNLKDIFKI